MIEERRSLRRLRQDLERVRLLCELIRKREQRKRELIVATRNITELKMNPFNYFLKTLLTQLKEIDHQEIFAEPVSLDDVPDYLDHIKIPMDFKTMNDKLETFQYENIDRFEADFNVMVENCLSYNERDTIFFRAGVKMRDQGGTIIRQAKREIESIGFDPASGLHTEERLTPKEELSDDKIMKEIDNFTNQDREDLPLDIHLKKLLELQDRVQFLHHPVAKVKRQKLLKQEITKVRRKASLEKTEEKKIKAGSLKATPQMANESGDDSNKSGKKTKKNKQREVSPVKDLDEVEAETPIRRTRGQDKETPKDTPKGKEDTESKNVLQFFLKLVD